MLMYLPQCHVAFTSGQFHRTRLWVSEITEQSFLYSMFVSSFDRTTSHYKRLMEVMETDPYNANLPFLIQLCHFHVDKTTLRFPPYLEFIPIKISCKHYTWSDASTCNCICTASDAYSAHSKIHSRCRIQDLAYEWWRNADLVALCWMFLYGMINIINNQYNI